MASRNVLEQIVAKTAGDLPETPKKIVTPKHMSSGKKVPKLKAIDTEDKTLGLEKPREHGDYQALSPTQKMNQVNKNVEEIY